MVIRGLGLQTLLPQLNHWLALGMAFLLRKYITMANASQAYQLSGMVQEQGFPTM